jgi:RHS repeat-associated protein
VTTVAAPPAASAPGGIVTAYSYDAAGKVTQTQQKSMGTTLRTTSTTYTTTGKTATTTDANGNVTRHAYDAMDRLSRTTDAMGRVTIYTYDALSRPYEVFNPAIPGLIPPDYALVRQTYTADGLRAALTDAGNHTTSFAYDGFDRLATTTYPGGTTETYGYDADSNVTARKTRASSTPNFAYAYDTLNRLITKAPSTGPVVSYAYDLAGRLTGVSDTSTAIQAIAMPASTTTYSTTYSYDALNRPTGVTFGDVPALTAAAPPSNVQFTHSYNAANQRSGQTVSDNSWIDYPASPGGTCYTANDLNQYTGLQAISSGTCSGGTVSPTYDDDGNLRDDGTYRYAYDAENRLTSVSPSGNGTLCVIACYTYDGRGRRKTRTVGGTTTVVVTDADNREVLEYNGTSGSGGTILRWYAYGLGPNDVLAQMSMTGTPTRLTPIPDLLGSVIATLSNAGGLTSHAYQPYGSSSAPPAQFGFTGQRFDAETGLYYYRARHYSAAMGRFLQADPIGYSDGTHLYAYVSNDPLNLIDALGLAGGPSFGQSLAQAMINTVPGAYYASLMQEQFRQGSYGGAAIYGVASLLDAGLGAVTLGTSTPMLAAARGAIAEGQSIFRQSFNSFDLLKNYIGRAGPDMQWHHIVEQNKVEQFGLRAINSVENIVAIPVDAHNTISGYYASIRPFSDGMRVRDWLSGKTFSEQYEFGMNVLRETLGYR